MATLLRRRASEASESSEPVLGPVPRPAPARVNLLPESFLESDRVRLVQSGLAAALLAAAATVAGVHVQVSAEVEEARVQVQAAQAAQTQVTAEIAALGGVRELYAEVEQRQALLDEARASSVPWSRLLSDLSLIVPEGVWVENVNVGPATGGAGPTITFSGRGGSHGDVATWIETMSAHPGLTDATFSTSALNESLAEQTVAFTSTGAVDPEALEDHPEES
jgi:Tfp pilus assembly protein PilN